MRFSSCFFFLAPLEKNEFKNCFVFVFFLDSDAHRIRGKGKNESNLFKTNAHSPPSRCSLENKAANKKIFIYLQYDQKCAARKIRGPLTHSTIAERNTHPILWGGGERGDRFFFLFIINFSAVLQNVSRWDTHLVTGWSLFFIYRKQKLKEIAK